MEFRGPLGVAAAIGLNLRAVPGRSLRGRLHHTPADGSVAAAAVLREWEAGPAGKSLAKPSVRSGRPGSEGSNMSKSPSIRKRATRPLPAGRTKSCRFRQCAGPSRSRLRRVTRRRPSAPGERAGVPPPRRSRCTPTISGWGGAGPSAPTGTTGSKPSGGSRPRPEGPGGTSLRPPGRAAVRGACPRSVGTLSVRVSSFTTVMSPYRPLRVEDRVDAFQRFGGCWARSPSTFVPEAWVSRIRPDSSSSSWRCAGPRAAPRRRRRSGSPGFRLIASSKRASLVSGCLNRSLLRRAQAANPGCRMGVKLRLAG